jgi:hypothetical protein
VGHLTAKARPKVFVVAHAAGKMSFSDASEQVGNGQLWLTADKKLTIATNGPDGHVVRRVFDIERADMSVIAGRFTLVDGRKLDVAIKPCGCGMGAAGNARIMDEPHVVVQVTRPDWVVVSS